VEGTGKRGCQRIWWRDEVEGDLSIMGINGRQAMVRESVMEGYCSERKDRQKEEGGGEEEDGGKEEGGEEEEKEEKERKKKKKKEEEKKKKKKERKKNKEEEKKKKERKNKEEEEEKNNLNGYFISTLVLFRMQKYCYCHLGKIIMLSITERALIKVNI
jgi:cation transport ATPase